MGNLRNTPFAVGYNSNKKVEAKFDDWIVLGDFPFATTYYYYYSTLTFQDELFYIGEFQNMKNVPHALIIMIVFRRYY